MGHYVIEFVNLKSVGANLVIHATTKYLGGHSDVLGGVAIALVEDDFFKRITPEPLQENLSSSLLSSCTSRLCGSLK